MKRVAQWHQLAGCVIHCSASHIEIFHVKEIQCSWGYFLTFVVNWYVSISLWVSAGCVFRKVRRVCPGSAPLGIIPLHISCFAHDNTVSFFKDTGCMYKASGQSYYCTIARVSTRERTPDSNLSHLSIESFRTWIQAHCSNKLNLKSDHLRI